MQVFVFGLRGQQQGHAHFDDQEEEGGVTGEPWTPICNKAWDAGARGWSR